tara:strand:- start:701 stop:1417 length:717 start_codon:yes stop_codon:yes gene_type:complete
METFDCKFMIDEINKIINDEKADSSSISPNFTFLEPNDPNILNLDTINEIKTLSPIDTHFNLPPEYKSKLIEFLVQHQLESLSLSFEETTKMNHINQHLNTIIYLLNRSQFILGEIYDQKEENQFNIPYLIGLFEENSNQQINILVLFIKLLLDIKDEVCLDFSTSDYNYLNQYQIIVLSKINQIMDWIDNNSYFNNYPNLDLNQLIIHNDIKIIYDFILIIYNFCQIIFYVLSLEEL